MIQGTTTLEVAQRFEEASRLERLQGVTFSGGEPMQQAEALLELMREIRQAAPAVSFGMFTGYTENELAAGRYVTRLRATVEQKRTLWQTVRGLLDFAVMGRYDQTQPTMEPLRTGRNQQLVLFSNRCRERATSDLSSSRSASRRVGDPYSRDSPCSAFLPEAQTPEAGSSGPRIPHIPRTTRRQASPVRVDVCLSTSDLGVMAGIE